MSDTFRKEYKPLHAQNTALVQSIKLAAEAIEKLLLKVKSREMSLAMTYLEQCTMWATKAIVLSDEKSGGQPIE